MEPFGDWVRWPGRWGNSERVIAQKIGNGPPTPSRQGSKWTSPAAFQAKMRRRKFRALLGRLFHRLGGPFTPTRLSCEPGSTAIGWSSTTARTARGGAAPATCT